MTAQEIIARCRRLAEFTEEPGFTTRTFLSPPMREVHALVREWMESAGMGVRVDEAGNVRGCYPARKPAARRLYIGSHLDTVLRAGAFDGTLGVAIGIALIESLRGRPLAFSIEVVGFSEEEGVRFGVPFIGSRALAGEADEALLATADRSGVTVREALRAFGLDPARIGAARAEEGALGYLEFHIEQGPVLEHLGLAVAAVEAITGQSRLLFKFQGKANHAGTTPMHLRRDALTGAAEWVLAVEREAGGIPGMVATAGRMEVEPGAGNVIPGEVRVSLDVRHADCAVRRAAVWGMTCAARAIAERRGLRVAADTLLDQPSVAMDRDLTDLFGPLHRMTSGAGHDAMTMARRMPAAMLFVRSPGGVSHHPDETVRVEDVAAALRAGRSFLDNLEARIG